MLFALIAMFMVASYFAFGVFCAGWFICALIALFSIVTKGPTYSLKMLIVPFVSVWVLPKKTRIFTIALLSAYPLFYFFGSL